MIDPLTFFTFLGAIVAGAGFLYVLITMNIMGRKRRELRPKHVFLDILNAGE